MYKKTDQAHNLTLRAASTGLLPLAPLALLAALATAGLGCDTAERNPVVQRDAATPDAATPKDAGSQAEAALDTVPPKPDLGPKTCPTSCPPPTASGISLCGQVLLFSTLAARRAGALTHATPLSGTQGATLDIFDPLKFVAAPTTSQPLASATIDADGCFVAKDATIPFAGFFALVVRDAPGSTSAHWVLTGSGLTPTPGQTSQGLEIAAVTKSEAAAWTKELGFDPVAAGAAIVVFVDGQGKAVEGVAPVLEGKDWPNWDNNPATGNPHRLFFFDKDPSKPPYFDASAGATTASGMALVIRAQVKTYSGTKSGATFGAKLGGCSPGTLFVHTFTLGK